MTENERTNLAKNHTIDDACKHFNCSFKELVGYAEGYEKLPEEITTKCSMKYT